MLCTYLGAMDIHEDGKVGEMRALASGVCGVGGQHTAALLRPLAVKCPGENTTHMYIHTLLTYYSNRHEGI